MTAAERLRLISEADYLAGELTSPVKHEYLGGYVHALAGANIQHNVIAGNTFASQLSASVRCSKKSGQRSVATHFTD